MMSGKSEVSFCCPPDFVSFPIQIVFVLSSQYASYIRHLANAPKVISRVKILPSIDAHADLHTKTKVPLQHAVGGVALLSDLRAGPEEAIVLQHGRPVLFDNRHAPREAVVDELGAAGAAPVIDRHEAVFGVPSVALAGAVAEH